MSGPGSEGVHNEIDGPVHGGAVQARDVFGNIIFYADEARTARAREFEAQFRRGVLHLLDRIQLWGVDELPWHLRNYRLSTAYMNLSLEATGENSTLDGSGLRVEDVVVGRRRLLLEGHAGSGKTTALHHLAIRGLRGELLREGDDSPAMVPFLIKMRGCYDREKRLRLPPVEKFVAAVASTIADGKPEDWVAHLLRRGRGMVFLDGVDEISDKDRPAVLAWLEQLLAYYPDASYVLTSRPAAITESWRQRLRSHGFATARLEPMTPAQVSGFIDRWHRAVAEGDLYHPDRVMEAGQDLKNELAARRDLARLARSPLMCAVLSAQHLRGGRLDGSRSQLFRRSTLVDFLIERRDVQRSIRQRSDWHRLLAPLAHWLVMAGEDTLPRKTAVILINRVTGGDRHQAEYTLQLMMEQTGLLELVDGERVGFRFPGFQDYLAAQEFLDQMHHRHLVSHAHLPAYQEVIIMAVEQEAERDSWLVLSSLVDRAGRSRDRHRRRLWLLAAACIADLPTDKCPELADRIRSMTREFLPPRDLGEADEIAKAGDFVLDLLADAVRSGSVTNATAPAVIHSATLIDADQAIPLISRFRHADDPAIQRELAAGWCRVREYESYAREVLGDAALGATWIDLPHVSALPALSLITGLRNLRLPREADSATLKALTELDGLPDRLEAISLADTAVTDLTPLNRLPCLRRLDLSNTPVTDLSPLARLPGLKVHPAQITR